MTNIKALRDEIALYLWQFINGKQSEPAGAETLAKRAVIDFDYLENELCHGRPFLLGERATLVDCTLAAGIQFARFREMGLPGTYPAITEWYEAYKARPHVQAHLFF